MHLSNTRDRADTALRVCHVVPHLDRVGGYERQALLLARVQSERASARPRIVTHRASGRELAREALPCRVDRVARGLRHFDPSPWWRRHAREVDLVHAHAVHRMAASLIGLADSQGLPSLLKIPTARDFCLYADPKRSRARDADAETARLGLARRLLYRRAFAKLCRADGFVVLNEESRAELERYGIEKERIFALPNGVDLESFRAGDASERKMARRGMGLPPDAFVVGYLGRLAERKQLRDLVEALALLNTPAHLVLAGDGGQRRPLERLAREKGLAERVHFFGSLSDVPSFFRGIDLFVNPSAREGLPNAVLEAWASGCPTLLSDIPGHRDTPAGRGCAAFYPVRDPRELARSLATLAAEPGRRQALGCAARQAAVRFFSIEAVAAHYAGLYALLRERRRARTPDPQTSRSASLGRANARFHRDGRST